MPEFQAPGVITQKIQSSPQSISGVPTATVGFLGQTEWGTTVPQIVTSWSDYQTIFGNHIPDVSYLSYAVAGFFLNGGQRCWVGRIVPDETATIADYRSGLKAFAEIDEISIVVLPDDVRAGLEHLSAELINHCERLGRFGIVSAEKNAAPISSLRPPHDSTNAAFYYPWIKVWDAQFNISRIIPPTGHVAGIYAKTDNSRGVWKAPANEIVTGAIDIQKKLSSAEQNILNPRGVNCIRDFRTEGRGIRVWGARTMSSDPEWRHVPIRRLYLYMEASLKQGLGWVVFEPNGEPLWDRVRQSVETFLMDLWRQDALLGSKSEAAFFVKCDHTTMTQSDIDNGQLVVQIGFAPVLPAEFIILQIRQKTAGS